MLLVGCLVRLGSCWTYQHCCLRPCSPPEELLPQVPNASISLTGNGKKQPHESFSVHCERLPGTLFTICLLLNMYKCSSLLGKGSTTKPHPQPPFLSDAFFRNTEHTSMPLFILSFDCSVLVTVPVSNRDSGKIVSQRPTCLCPLSNNRVGRSGCVPYNLQSVCSQTYLAGLCVSL